VVLLPVGETRRSYNPWESPLPSLTAPQCRAGILLAKDLGIRAMPTYKAPVEDVQFLLNDVFHIDRYSNLPGFADASADVVEAILGEAAKFCEQVLTPLNR